MARTKDAAQVLPLSFLQDVHRSVGSLLRESSSSSIVSVADITNDVNQHDRYVASMDEVEKALLELQVMDSLEFSWKGWQIYVRRVSPEGPEKDLWILTQTYGAPAPYDIMAKVVTYIQQSQANPIVFGEMSGTLFMGEGTLSKILRELRMMRVLNFSIDKEGENEYLFVFDKNFRKLSRRKRRKMFGRINE